MARYSLNTVNFSIQPVRGTAIDGDHVRSLAQWGNSVVQSLTTCFENYEADRQTELS